MQPAGRYVMSVITWHVRMDLPVLYAFNLICLACEFSYFQMLPPRLYTDALTATRTPTRTPSRTHTRTPSRTHTPFAYGCEVSRPNMVYVFIKLLRSVSLFLFMRF
jgi:hypothetical protein